MTRFSEKMDTVLVNTDDGNTKEVLVPCTIGCEGEVIIGKLYVIGTGDPAVATVTGGADLGKARNQVVRLTIDVTDVEVGNYGLKFYTEETGVIAKAICVIR